MAAMLAVSARHPKPAPESQSGPAPVVTDAFVPGSLADLLFQLGEKGVRVRSGAHGEHWSVEVLEPTSAVPDGLAAALFNALEAYEAIRDSFPALKDREIHIDQCRMLRQHASQLLEASRGDLLIAEQAVEAADD